MTIPRNVAAILQILLVGLAFLVLGWGLSMVVVGISDYWQAVMLVSTLVFGFILLGVAVVLIYHNRGSAA